MSVIAIIAVVVTVLGIVFFIGGYIYSQRRLRSPEWEGHVRRADEALEQARALDRGWDREVMEGLARDALGTQHAGWPYEDLHLVLVDDKPGVEDDMAHFVAVGPEGDKRLVLIRRGGNWSVDRIE